MPNLDIEAFNAEAVSESRGVLLPASDLIRDDGVILGNGVDGSQLALATPPKPQFTLGSTLQIPGMKHIIDNITSSITNSMAHFKTFQDRQSLG